MKDDHIGPIDGRCFMGLNFSDEDFASIASTIVEAMDGKSLEFGVEEAIAELIRERNELRDAVLFSFHQECDDPTAEQIIGWCNRYPSLAGDIRGHAAVAKDWLVRKDLPSAEPSADMLANGLKRALEAINTAKRPV